MMYDFVLFVQSAKQEIPQQAVKQRKFWRFNVVVVYCNLLFLLLFGTFWYTLWRSRTPNQKFAEIFRKETICGCHVSANENIFFWVLPLA